MYNFYSVGYCDLKFRLLTNIELLFSFLEFILTLLFDLNTRTHYKRALLRPQFLNNNEFEYGGQWLNIAEQRGKMIFLIKSAFQQQS